MNFAIALVEPALGGHCYDLRTAVLVYREDLHRTGGSLVRRPDYYARKGATNLTFGPV